MQPNGELQELLDKYLNDQMSKGELVRFRNLLRDSSNKAELTSLIEAVLRQQRYKDAPAVEKDKLFSQLIQKAETAVAPVHRIHFLRTAWFRYAAAIILIFGIGSYLFLSNQKRETTLATKNNSVPVPNDILPGSNRALLTLSDGRSIALDSATNGQLAMQSGSRVVKKDGQIIYNAENISAKNVVYNSMSTPRGGQYKLTLPDGTKVWLNAATSITFPIAFVGKERRVKITGEVYFEVAKNAQHPFVVDVDGKSLVEVLGTSFNINSYQDEKEIKTTLIEGSVKVTNQNKHTVIVPGQQAIIPSDQQLRIVNADVDQVIAWKNGKFNFNNADLYTVMRQLGRWYDIQINYEGNISNEIFQGELTRDLTLSQVLKILSKMEIKFRLEGKTLIVSG